MKPNEMAFLSQVALGVFSVDKEGRIWRHYRMAGSRLGNPSASVPLDKPERAERSVSQSHLRVMFTVDGERQQVYAHRIVWMIANHSDIPPAFEVNHKDGIPVNNRPDNLELATRQENTLHAGRVLRRLGKKEQRGEKNTSAKLTAGQVIEIRKAWADRSASLSTLARQYGVSDRTIQDICHRRTWKHLPE